MAEKSEINPEKSEKLEDGPALEEILGQPGDAGNPEIRATIEAPEGDAVDWKEVAQPKKKRGRPAKVDPEEAARQAAEVAAKAEAEARRVAAESTAGAIEIALIFFGRMVGVGEENLKFAAEEKKALAQAVEPLCGPIDNPWITLAVVSASVLGPRALIIGAAVKAQNEQKEAARCQVIDVAA